MQKKFKKVWSIVSIAFVLALLTSLFFFPSITRSLSSIVMLVGLTVMIVFTIQHHLQAQRAGKITRPCMLRAIAVNLTSLLLTMAAAILIAGRRRESLPPRWRAAPGVARRATWLRSWQGWSLERWWVCWCAGSGRESAGGGWRGLPDG